MALDMALNQLQGPLECTFCHATETACWRRHHKTRDLLCNRCGVKANTLNNRRKPFGNKRPAKRPLRAAFGGRQAAAAQQAGSGGRPAAGVVSRASPAGKRPRVEFTFTPSLKKV